MSWRVGGKLALGFGSVLAVVVTSAVLSWRDGRRVLQHADHLYQEGVVVTEALGQAETQLHATRSAVYRHIATDDDPAALASAEDAIERETERFDQALVRAEAQLPMSDPRREKLEEVKALYSEYRRLRTSTLIPLSRQGDDSGALEFLSNDLQPAFERTASTLNELIQKQMVQSSMIHNEARETLNFTANVSLWSSLVAALVAGLIAYWLASSISGRLAALAAVARSFGEGNMERRASVEQSDEITEVSHAFNRMADELERTLAEQVNAAAKQKNESELLAAHVERYAAFLDRVAAGELTAQIGRDGEVEFVKLEQNLNAMAAGLRTITLRVHETVGALTSASAEILATSQQHSASASDTASAVAETVATVEEVAQAAQRMTETAQGVQSNAKHSREVARNGLLAVHRTTEAMARVKKQVSAIAEGILSLSEHAQTVGHIITTVNELAEQSNLLALNASIEATRAGEGGRAFGVVAQEIRALADQSKQATAQVRTILGAIQKATSAAVLATEEGQKTVVVTETTVNDAGKTIEQLADTLEQASAAADDILSAAEQQAQAVHQISDAMRSIDGAVRQTADSTSLVERAATDLNGLSGKLQQAVSQYRV